MPEVLWRERRRGEREGEGEGRERERERHKFPPYIQLNQRKIEKLTEDSVLNSMSGTT